MSTGIVVYALGNKYINQSQKLIDSLRYHGSNVEVHVVSQDVTNSRFSTDERSQVFDITPFDKTIVVDSDVLFCSNIDNIIKKLEKQSFFMPTTAYTYRNEIVTSNYYRKAFTKNNLSNVYVAFSYFEKTPAIENYFNTLKVINTNWQQFYKIFCPTYTPTQPSMDLNHAICLALHPEVDNKQIDVNLVHLKSKIQNWKNAPSNWKDKINAYLPNPGELWIGNYKQTGIVHYTEELLDE